MSEVIKNRFENWPEADVSEYIRLEKNISSIKTGNLVGMVIGLAAVFGGQLDGLGTTLIILMIIGISIYSEFKADKHANRLNELRLKNAFWPP